MDCVEILCPDLAYIHVSSSLSRVGGLIDCRIHFIIRHWFADWFFTARGARFAID